jgi:integrase
MAPGDVLADDEVRGFYARCLPSGVATYGFRYRDRPTGQRRWLSLGLHGQVTPQIAREIAKKHAGAVADGKDPLGDKVASRAAAKAARANPEKTVADVLDEHLERYARKQAARSSDEKERIFEKYIKPAIGDRLVRELKRSEIVALLDKIEDRNGPVMADRTLAHFRKALAWHATRDDLFNSPIVRGMARVKPKERARDRILNDDEIRSLWTALDTLTGPYPVLVRMLLLTAQRRDEVARMRQDEIEGTVWTIPSERYKGGHDNVVPLTDATVALLDSLPKPKKGGYYFTTNRKEPKVPFSGFSKAKHALDDAITKDRKETRQERMKPWVLHDLRRTARSLMSRAGVQSNIAERVLGHVIPGVAGVYDRHSYADEKREALEKLAAMVSRILHPPASNVVDLARRPGAA